MRKNILIMYTDHSPSEKHLAQIELMCSHYGVIVAKNETDAIKVASTTEIILGHRYLMQVLPFCSKLRWVQATGGGYDHLPVEKLRSMGVILTRTTFSSMTIAQHAIMLALALNRKLFDCFDSQKKRFWNSSVYKMIHPRPRIALVLGFGAIGKELAKILRSMNIEVWAVKRKEDKDSAELSDRLFTNTNWHQYLNIVDYLFVALPNSSSTYHILTEDLLSTLSSHAIVVNVARSELIDNDALFRLLSGGKIGGAGLDVFPGREALPENSPLWQIPNLIITPYMSARYADRWCDLEVFVEQQLKNYVSQKPLINIVE